MLASFVVHLKPKQLSPLGNTLGRSLHGLLLRLISEVDPHLANDLHSDSHTKPFTVSMLRGRLQRSNGQAVASPGETYEVRYTVLREDVFNALSHILMGKMVYEEVVTIDGNPFDVTEIVVQPDRAGGWAGLASYEELLRRAPVANRIALEFASPTTFRTGDVNLLFPLAGSVFGSYQRKWETFSPAPLPAGLDEFIGPSVVAERYELETRIVNYGRHQFNGFVGFCQYRVLAEEPAYLRAVNALADFAVYAGTGLKTTQGLGQTKRVRIK